MSRAKRFAMKFNQNYDGDLKYNPKSVYSLKTGKTSSTQSKLPNGYKHLTPTSAREYKLDLLLNGLPKNFQNVLVNGTKEAVKRNIKGLSVVEDKKTGEYKFYDAYKGKVLTKKEVKQRYHDNARASTQAYRTQTFDLTPEQLQELQESSFVKWNQNFVKTTQAINNLFYQASSFLTSIGQDLYNVFQIVEDGEVFSLFEDYTEDGDSGDVTHKLKNQDKKASIYNKLTELTSALDELEVYALPNDKDFKQVQEIKTELRRFTANLGKQHGKGVVDVDFKSLFGGYMKTVSKLNKYVVISSDTREFNKMIRFMRKEL